MVNGQRVKRAIDLDIPRAAPCEPTVPERAALDPADAPTRRARNAADEPTRREQSAADAPTRRERSAADDPTVKDRSATDRDPLPVSQASERPTGWPTWWVANAQPVPPIPPPIVRTPVTRRARMWIVLAVLVAAIIAGAVIGRTLAVYSLSNAELAQP